MALATSPFSVLEKRRQCKFIPEWTLKSNFSSWLLPVGDPHKAFCRVCRKVFPVRHGGLHDVKAHAKGKRHLLLSQQLFQENHLSLNQILGPQAIYDWNHLPRPPIFDSPLIDVSVSTSHIPNNPFTSSDMNPRISSIDTSQQYCLRWKYHHSNLQLMFSQLLERQSFCDVTLACEGKHIRAHKVMLSACSTYFDSILSQHDENNPIVVFKDVRFEDLKALVQFMYKGEIKIENSQLMPLLKTAEELRIKGLAKVSWQDPAASTRKLEEAEDLEDEEEELCASPAKRARTSEPSITSSVWNTPISVLAAKLSAGQNTSQDKGENKRDDDVEIIDDHTRIQHEGYEQTRNEREGYEQTRNTREAYEQTRNTREAYEQSRNTREGYEQSRAENESREEPNEAGSDRDLSDEDDELPLPIAPETVYDAPVTEDDEPVDEERNIFSDGEEEMKVEKKRDENGNEEVDEFEMPGVPAHLTNSAFSSLLESQEEMDEGTKVNSSTEEKSIDYSKYSYVVKMNEFLDQGGRRPQFWEETSTRRVMEAIKNKELEMKQGAEIMGVSYGTLYGRYRDAYGCLKHPYRVKEFWSEQGPSEVLDKLRRGELTLFRAAELINVTVTTLANYLATLRHSSPDGEEDYYERPPSLFASTGKGEDAGIVSPEH